jgi:hypothetical protein
MTWFKWVIRGWCIAEVLVYLLPTEKRKRMVKEGNIEVIVSDVLFSTLVLVGTWIWL